MVKLFQSGGCAGWAEQEYNNIQNAFHAGVAVPAVEGMVQVDGRHGVVLEHVAGPTMSETMRTKPWHFVRIAQTLAELQADFHDRKVTGFPLLRSQLDARIRTSFVADRIKHQSLQLLETLPDGDRICHADFNPRNVLMARDGPVVIDWVHAMKGNPLADVAFTLLTLRPRSKRFLNRGAGLAYAAFRKLYLRRYSQLRPTSRKQIAAFLLPVAVAHLGEDLRGDLVYEKRWLRIVNGLLSREGEALINGWHY